jgi:hypothetical protein
MKYLASRFVIFPALGPLIGLAVVIAPFAMTSLLLSSVSPETMSDGSGKLSNTWICLMITAAAYVAGLLPAMAAAIADWHFADHTNRVLKTSLIGCASSLAFMLILLAGRLDIMIVLAAIAGAAAACVCSLIHRSLQRFV